MKILIAFDGSACSEAALDDLPLAGLPETGEAVVTSVAEVWLPPPGMKLAVLGASERYLESTVQKHRAKAERILNHADILSKHAAMRVRAMLPGWNVNARSTYGSPGWEILRLADEIGADLIVVGAHGHSMIGRLLLGSISQKVVTEAKCSVRVARGRVEVDPAPARIIVGFDGSPGAMAAVETVAARTWKSGGEVRLVTATDPPSANLGRFLEPCPNHVSDVDEEDGWIIEPLDAARQRLEKNSLHVSTLVLFGNPKREIVRAAEEWHADAIFVGANFAGGQVAGMILGSTTMAIAARAHCSVEVVRSNASAR